MKPRATRSKARKYRKRTRRGGGFFGCTGASCSTGVAEAPSAAPASVISPKSRTNINTQYKAAILARTARLRNSQNALDAMRARITAGLPETRNGFGNTTTPGLPPTRNGFGNTTRKGLPETRNGFGGRF